MKFQRQDEKRRLLEEMKENEEEFKELMPLIRVQNKSEILRESTSNEEMKHQIEKIS